MRSDALARRRARRYANAMRIHILLAGLLFAGIAYGEAYRWVDENGVVHYSDRRMVEQAEAFELPQPGDGVSVSRGTTRRPAISPPRASRGDSAASRNYQGLEVLHPGQDETLWNIGGSLKVSLRLTPALKSGDRVQVLYDGVAVSGLTGNSLDVTLTEVHRGEHTIQAEILDSADNSVIQSSVNVFYVQQSSVLRN